MANTCRWTGVSGWGYDYHILPWNTPLPNLPGNYVLCRHEGNTAIPLYVGEAEDLGNRCNDNHEKWFAAIRLGATHIHAKGTSGGKTARCAEETDLRHAFDPPLNRQ